MNNLLDEIRFRHYGMPITFGIHRDAFCVNCDREDSHDWTQPHGSAVERMYRDDVDIYIKFDFDNSIFRITNEEYDFILGKVRH
jgi:hypothetical protein